MTRFALILPLIACLATPAVADPLLAEIVPVPRPEGLVERTRAAAEAAEAAAEAEGEAEVALAQTASPDRAAIAAQISGAIRDCWNVSDLSEEAMAVRIWLAFDTLAEGEIIRETIEMTRFENGTQEAADEALGPAFRAIMRCGNAGLDLPEETHAIWQRVEIVFDASSVVTR